MKLITSCHFLFATAFSAGHSEDPLCNHAGCEAGIEESTLLQLGQRKTKSKSKSTGPRRLAQWVENVDVLDQRLLSALSYAQSHEGDEMPSFMACVNQIAEDTLGDTFANFGPEAYAEWNACLDEAEEADGIAGWLQEEGGEPASLVQFAKKTNSSRGSTKTRSVTLRPGLPSYCEDWLPDDHGCSCVQTQWRHEMHLHHLILGMQNIFNFMGQMFFAMAEAFAHCGFSCSVHVDWAQAHNGIVTAGDTWEMTYGYEVSNGFERTTSTETEISATLETSVGIEFEGIGVGSSASTTETIRQGVSESINRQFTTSAVAGRSRTFPSGGQVWQARSTVYDTCGGSLSMITPELALTYHRTSPPRCYPGSCYTHGANGYCCSCINGEELPGAAPCLVPDCPAHASALYSITGYHTSSIDCGRQLSPGEQCVKQCSHFASGYSGTITLECSDVDGSVAVVGNSCQQR